MCWIVQLHTEHANILTVLYHKKNKLFFPISLVHKSVKSKPECLWKLSYSSIYLMSVNSQSASLPNQLEEPLHSDSSLTTPSFWLWQFEAVCDRQVTSLLFSIVTFQQTSLTDKNCCFIKQKSSIKISGDKKIWWIPLLKEQCLDLVVSSMEVKTATTWSLSHVPSV